MLLVHDFLRGSATAHPTKVAIVAGKERCTYAELDQSSDQFASALQDARVRRGDRVALIVENSVALVIAIFGVLKAGGVVVPLAPSVKLDKLTYLLADCGVRAVIAAPGCAPAVLRATERVASVETLIWTGPCPTGRANDIVLPQVLDCPRRGPANPGLIDQDLCTIIYTSGSTGEPKGVMLTHRNVTNTAWAISTYLGNTPDDVVICVLPLSFDYGLYQVLTAARLGFTVVLERSFAYPYDTLQRMAEHRVTGLPGVPTIFASLLEMASFNGADLSALRYMTNTAAPLPPVHIRRLQGRFPGTKIFSMYGLTECTRVSYLPPERLADKVLSVGKAMPNSETYIVDEQGRRVGPGIAGELVVRGANVMLGYWGKPAETARCLRPGELAGEHVLHTGDQFMMDDEGFLYFQGRGDDIFKCRGMKVSPREIENVIYELDGVAEAAVVGVPDAIEGHAIKICIALRPDAQVTESRVRHYCRTKLETAFLPKFIEIHPALPKTETGKIRKAALR